MLASIDQCAGCHYFNPTFVPDGRLLAIVKDGSKTRLILVSANGQAVSAIGLVVHIERVEGIRRVSGFGRLRLAADGRLEVTRNEDARTSIEAR